MEGALKILGHESTKLDRLDGTNFTRWREKMMFFLTALKIFYILDPTLQPLPEASENDTEKTIADRKKREEDELLCRGYILNNLSDRLYDLYTPMKSAKEIWDSLENKYNVEKQGADKFIIFKFFEFAMTDSMSILDQAHEFLILASKLKDLKIEIPEKFLVGGIIAKLPSAWKNFQRKLLHTTEDFTLESIQKHLRIEEETQNREKSLNASTSKVNAVEGNSQQNKGKKRKNNPNNSNKKSKKNMSDVVCYNCGEKGHFKRNCRNPKKKKQRTNQNGGSDNKVNAVEDTTQIVAMVSDLHIGMIQEMHMASVTKTNDWWYDSGATAHVCNNKSLFKDYTESAGGHEVLLGDHHTTKVLGTDSVELQFTLGKKVLLTSVLHVPEIRKNLVSGFMLCKKGIKAVI